jgi:hypothetical protein
MSIQKDAIHLLLLKTNSVQPHLQEQDVISPEICAFHAGSRRNSVASRLKPSIQQGEAVLYYTHLEGVLS